MSYVLLSGILFLETTKILYHMQFDQRYNIYWDIRVSNAYLDIYVFCIMG